MGGEDRKKWVQDQYPPHISPITVLSIPARTRLIPTPYEAYTHLFKALVCYLCLNILLVALSYVIFKILATTFCLKL